MLDQDLLDEPIVSFYFSDNSNEGNESEAVFGGVNNAHFTGDLVKINVRRKAYWEVDLETIDFGEDTHTLENTGAVLDTGSSLISLPSDLAELLNYEIGAKRSRTGHWTVECDKRDSFPDLTFTLAGHKFSIGPYDYILEVSGSCISSFTGVGKSFRYICWLYSDVAPLDFSGPGSLVHLGVPFLRRWYSVYDLGDNSVGLAKAK